MAHAIRIISTSLPRWTPALRFLRSTRTIDQRKSIYNYTIARHKSTAATDPANGYSASVRFDDRCLRFSLPTASTNQEFQISTIWLRDHCRCSTCYNFSTNQRTTNIVSLRTRPTIVDATIERERAPQVRVLWNDGHRSTYDLDWIKDNWCNPRSRYPKPLLWSAEDMKSRGGLPTVPYIEIINSEKDGLKRLLENVMIYGVAMISDAPSTFEETKRVCEMIALPEETMYGKFWQFSAENMDHADTAYTNTALGAHTDLTYYSQTAGLQVFHLLEHSAGQGGSTLLVDGFNAAEKLRNEDPKAFHFLSTKPIPCHSLEGGAHYFSQEPVIALHPQTNEFKQFRFNIYDRAPLSNFNSIEDVEEFYRAYIALAEIIQNSQNEVWINLKPGTILIIDNFRVLHGRTSFTGKRIICGCYLQRDSFISKVRGICC